MCLTFFRGDFLIKWDMVLEKSAIGVFEFMEEACKHFLFAGSCFAEVQPRKTKGAVKVQRTPIAAKMFWSKLEDFLQCYSLFVIATLISAV